MTSTLTALIFAILTATITASEFLQPWTAGSTKDYSHNINYALGVHITTEWEADFTNATIALNQDNKPGDAQGGPNVVLDRKFPSIPSRSRFRGSLEVLLSGRLRPLYSEIKSQGPTTRRHGDGR